MISSSNRVLKAGTINVDHVNKVTIEIPSVEENILPDTGEGDAEEKAMNAAARILNTANMQANEILNKARMEALAIQQKIEDETKKEAQRLLKETRENAYNEAMEQATEEGNRIIDDAKRVLADAKKERLRLQETLEPDIVRLITSITDKIIGNASTLNPKTILYLIKQGFGTQTITGDVKVLVSHEDFDVVKMAKEELLAFTDGAANLEIVKDAALAPCECIIETSIGHIDCSLDVQYSALKENLTYILQNRG